MNIIIFTANQPKYLSQLPVQHEIKFDSPYNCLAYLLMVIYTPFRCCCEHSADNNLKFEKKFKSRFAYETDEICIFKIIKNS